MRALGHAVLASLSAASWTAALIPLLAASILGAPGLSRSAADPAIVHAASASLLAGSIAVAVGWPAGVLAALGLWGARPGSRRVVLGVAILAVLLPIALSAESLDGSSAALPALLPPTAAVASVVLLILTGTLNTMDPTLLQACQTLGAPPARAWVVILASLRTSLIFAAAASFTLALAVCMRMPDGLTLAGLLARAIRQADVAAASQALLLALLSLAPLILVGLTLLPRRVFRRA